MKNNINSLIKEHLDAEDCERLDEYLDADQLNGARLLIERNMLGLESDSPKFIVLNDAYDCIINEIEMAYEL